MCNPRYALPAPVVVGCNATRISPRSIRATRCVHLLRFYLFICLANRVASRATDGAVAAAADDMTWSIIARDRDTGQFGITVATRFFAVGALVPHAKSRVGAIATQALVNPFYGTDGLRLLEQGKSACGVVRAVTAADAGRDHRQVHGLDGQGPMGGPAGKAS